MIVNKPPKITVVENADGTGYGIVGFAEFDLWARRNVNLWNYATGICMVNEYSEEDRIKLIACALAEQVYETMMKGRE